MGGSGGGHFGPATRKKVSLFFPFPFFGLRSLWTDFRILCHKFSEVINGLIGTVPLPEGGGVVNIVEYGALKSRYGLVFFWRRDGSRSHNHRPGPLASFNPSSPTSPADNSRPENLSASPSRTTTSRRSRSHTPTRQGPTSAPSNSSSKTTRTRTSTRPGIRPTRPRSTTRSSRLSPAGRSVRRSSRRRPCR